MFVLEIFVSFLAIVLPVLISVAYLTLAERKIMGGMQQRVGPNVVGFLGLLQPLADGLKLLLKESVIPTNSNTFGFRISKYLSKLCNFNIIFPNSNVISDFLMVINLIKLFVFLNEYESLILWNK